MKDKDESKKAFRLLNFAERATLIESILKKHESVHKKQFMKLMNGNLTSSNLDKVNTITFTIYDSFIENTE